MFNLNADSKIRGPGYIVLNAIRALNVIALLLVAIASWVMLVMTVKTSNVWNPDLLFKFIFTDFPSSFSLTASLTSSPVPLQSSLSFLRHLCSKPTSQNTGQCSATHLVSSSLAYLWLRWALIFLEIWISRPPVLKIWDFHCGGRLFRQAFSQLLLVYSTSLQLTSSAILIWESLAVKSEVMVQLSQDQMSRLVRHSASLAARPGLVV